MKIKSMMKNASAPVKASFWFMICNIMQKAVSVITTMIFTRMLSKTDYGIMNTFQSYYGVFSVLITLCLAIGVYSNAMIDFKDELDQFTSSMSTLITINTAVAFVLYLIFKPQILKIIQIPEPMVYLLFLSIWLNPAMDFWYYQQRFNYKYKLSIFISLFTSIGGAILAYVCIVTLDWNKAVSKIFGGSILTFIIAMFIYISTMVKGKVFVNRKYWKYALSFSIPLIPHFLSNVILSSSDRIIIGHMVNQEAVGLYGVAYSAGTIIQIISSSVNASWIPWTYKHLDKKEFDVIGKLSKTLVIGFAIACFGFIVFAPEVIAIFASKKYQDAIWCMPPIILGVFFIFIYSLFSNIEFFYKKTKLITVATCCAAVLNVVLNIIFIPIFGYIAAAYTTLIGYIALSVAHYFFMKRAQSAEIYDVKFIVIVSTVLCLCSFVIMAFYKLFIIRYAIIIAMCIGFFVKRDYVKGFLKQIKG